MNDIIEIINSLDGLCSLGSVSKKEVDNAEAQLNLKFSIDYKMYVMAYGAISANRIELTGICTSPRLSVINKTIDIRSQYDIPVDMYVIEDMEIEQEIILQKANGEIYSFSSARGIKMINKSLSEYILSFEK